MEAPGPPSHRDSHLPSSFSWVLDFSFSASSFSPSVFLICLGGGSLPQACLSWSLRRDVETSISSPLCRIWVLRFLSPSLFRPHSPVYPFSEVFILFSRLPPRPVSHFWSGSWHLRERQEALFRALVLPSHPLPEADRFSSEPRFPCLDLTRSLPSRVLERMEKGGGRAEKVPSVGTQWGQQTSKVSLRVLHPQRPRIDSGNTEQMETQSTLGRAREWPGNPPEPPRTGEGRFCKEKPCSKSLTQPGALRPDPSHFPPGWLLRTRPKGPEGSGQAVPGLCAPALTTLRLLEKAMTRLCPPRLLRLCYPWTSLSLPMSTKQGCSVI